MRRAIVAACIATLAIAILGPARSIAAEGPLPADAGAAARAQTDAIAWYDTLGFPDARDLPYVRVSTGLWTQAGNQPRENTFVEGFLVGEDGDSFTVFLCNVSGFATRFDSIPTYSQLTTVRFVRKPSGPAHEQVGYETLDFRRVATAVLERVGQRASGTEEFLHDTLSRPVSHRVRIFAFARACLQKGIADVGNALIAIAANIRIEQTGVIAPARLREVLQNQIGNAVLAQAEIDVGKPEIPWTTLLQTYAGFATRFPASDRIGYAQEAATVLRQTIAGEMDHPPRALDALAPAEQVRENIRQLHNLQLRVPYWSSGRSYPVEYGKLDGKDVPTAVHRLVDLGNVAVPQLLEAMDDRSFTRTRVASFNGTELPQIMRVGEVAANILSFMAGRSFGAVQGSGRQQAEAWWAELQNKGDRQQLIDSVTAAKAEGLNAARKLVEKYPDAALGAIELAVRSSTRDYERAEYVAVAGTLPGDAVVPFLRSQLAPDAGVYSQIRAAEALFSRSQPEAVPTMIEAWRRMQPRLPFNESNAYDEVGGLIVFLAKSGEVRAIEALGQNIRNAPVDVRLAVVRTFLPGGKNVGEFSSGRGVRRGGPDGYLKTLPAGEVGDAIEALLIRALADTEHRFGMSGHFGDANYTDPRVADMAALVLSMRWPEKYTFRWTTSAADCDAQINAILNRWGADRGLVALPQTGGAAVIPSAKEADVSPWLDRLARASPAEQPQITARIVQEFGLGALAMVRARLNQPEASPALRALADVLATIVRFVNVERGKAPAAITALAGQPLTAELLHKVAGGLESGLPPEARAVTFVAESAGNGSGFVITVGWRDGELPAQTGWEREMAVHSAGKNLYQNSGYSRGDQDRAKENDYRRMVEAFGNALQADFDAPIIVRLSIRRAVVPGIAPGN